MVDGHARHPIFRQPSFLFGLIFRSFNSRCAKIRCSLTKMARGSIIKNLFSLPNIQYFRQICVSPPLPLSCPFPCLHTYIFGISRSIIHSNSSTDSFIEFSLSPPRFHCLPIPRSIIHPLSSTDSSNERILPCGTRFHRLSLSPRILYPKSSTDSFN
jgi:hypothetical protein